MNSKQPIGKSEIAKILQSIDLSITSVTYGDDMPFEIRNIECFGSNLRYLILWGILNRFERFPDSKKALKECLPEELNKILIEYPSSRNERTKLIAKIRVLYIREQFEDLLEWVKNPNEDLDFEEIRYMAYSTLWHMMVVDRLTPEDDNAAKACVPPILKGILNDMSEHNIALTI